MRARRVFLAGATGAVGSEAVRLAAARGLELVPHARPKPGRPPPPGAAVFELADRPALVETLRGCTTVIQAIGTMRKRFAAGDTYETSDVGTTRLLADAAVEAGVDHLVLLSSVGAGRPAGAYLRAKAEAERIVRASGVPWTVLRPSAFAGEDRRPPPGADLVTRLLGLDRLRPIAVGDVASALLACAADRGPLGQVLEGTAIRAAAARFREGT